jgi:hypothetical protein
MLRLFIATLVILMFSGCVGKHPFKQVQLCLHDQAGSQLFVQKMKEISISHGMKFTDRSSETNRELATLSKKPDYQVMNISARRDDGVGWGAGNFGLSEFEVSIGFGGKESPAAREFADAVIRALEEKWRVYPVPPDRGAFPICVAQKPNNSFKPTPLRGVGKAR